MLEIDHVTASYSSAGRVAVALDDVSLQVAAGELVSVYGRRKSGRTTLLRVAGGIAAPSAGTVRFRGVDLRSDRNASLSSEIGVVHRSFSSIASTQPVLRHVAFAALARRVPARSAAMRAYELLDRVGAPADAVLADLDARERTLVAVARALAGEPRLLLVDEPTNGVDVLERDTISVLLRSIANDGIAVLATAPDMGAAAGATRVLHLTDGRLRGSLDAKDSADVVPLQPRRSDGLR